MQSLIVWPWCIVKIKTIGGMNYGLGANFPFEMEECEKFLIQKLATLWDSLTQNYLQMSNLPVFKIWILTFQNDVHKVIN